MHSPLENRRTRVKDQVFHVTCYDKCDIVYQIRQTFKLMRLSNKPILFKSLFAVLSASFCTKLPAIFRILALNKSMSMSSSVKEIYNDT